VCRGPMEVLLFPDVLSLDTNKDMFSGGAMNHTSPGISKRIDTGRESLRPCSVGMRYRFIGMSYFVS